MPLCITEDTDTFSGDFLQYTTFSVFEGVRYFTKSILKKNHRVDENLRCSSVLVFQKNLKGQSFIKTFFKTVFIDCDI